MTSTDYSLDQLQAALTAGQRVQYGRWQVVERTTGIVKGFLAGVQPGGTVAYSYLADVKRTCSFAVREAPNTMLLDDEIYWSTVDPNRDVVVPWFYLLMPDGRYAKWRKGKFVMEANTRGLESGGEVFVSVNGFDQANILLNDTVVTSTPYQIDAGTVITSEIRLILAHAGIVDVAIPDNTATLPVNKLFDPGATKLTIINQLFDMIGYGSIFFDDGGTATSRPYAAPADRAITHTYADDTASVIYPSISESVDIFDIPNRWVSVVSQSDREPLISEVNNLSPNSPTSQAMRGYIKTDFQSNSDAVSQAALDTQTRQRAAESSSTYRQISISTLTMPDHGEADMIDLTLTTMGIESEKFEETAWSMCIDSGGQGMTHELRAAVNIDDLG